MIWDNSSASDILNSINQFDSQIRNQSVGGSNIVHTKQELAHLIKIGAYRMDDIKWVSEDLKSEISNIIEHSLTLSCAANLLVSTNVC